MKHLSLPRRRFIAGIASATGAALTACGQSEPPTYGNILRMGDLLNYKAHRLLASGQPLAREYELSDISSSPAIGTTNPADPAKNAGFNAELAELYDNLQHGGFSEWRLSVEGAVSQPRSFSLAELQRMPSRTQITRHTCEEGWSAIAQWTGVPLRSVLEAVGIREDARFVQFYPFENWVDSIDMFDALHPQTILAYGMNGRELPIGHGAPLRARVETQLGYKSMKFLRRIVVTTMFEDPGPLGLIQNGWSWYAGI